MTRRPCPSFPMNESIGQQCLQRGQIIYSLTNTPDLISLQVVGRFLALSSRRAHSHIHGHRCTLDPIHSFEPVFPFPEQTIIPPGHPISPIVY
ncbi:hypothetical protein PISMIDRAFT_443673 [Pisolithus microcarpus 441]|uniref:Uncharacterized protein n=1 Tax=Pisolithus microcarpus 441 TaxID=765257 RepID=A0A0D0A5W6_9AGAM|nr:hypothetical protein PISMIDRAFT_443673 [Pisolithus microcarpus 441]